MRRLSVYGDSIAAGEGAPPGKGFVTRLAHLVAAGNNARARLLNFGQPGMASWQLASAMRDNEAWYDGLLTANGVCILIGGDDLVDGLPILLSGKEAGLKQVVAQSAAAYSDMLSGARLVTRGAVCVGTIYNPYPNTKFSAEAVSAYNELVIAPAAARFDIPVAPVHAAFEGREAELIDGYKDGVAGVPGRCGVRFPVHPNACGHLVIAKVFAPYFTR